ncbi:MAG: hypothetical protein LQ352_003944 [Teloschistes flavicans]|nr:MAG: hypothetical protein LQ352_003944 [Teloschistes flavicans]
MPPEIPGYVYDEERLAEDQRRKEDLLERTKFRQRQWKQQIQRSVILSMHPLGGFMGVQREHGSHEGRIETANNQIWAKGLKQESFIIQGPRPLPDQSGDIRHFVHEPNTGAILYFPSWSENRSLNNAE